MKKDKNLNKNLNKNKKKKANLVKEKMPMHILIYDILRKTSI